MLTITRREASGTPEPLVWSLEPQGQPGAMWEPQHSAQAAEQEAHGGAGQQSPSQTHQGQLLEGMGWVCAHGARKLGTGCPMEQAVQRTFCPK